MEDFGLVVASMRQQYGLRVQSDEFRSMGWDEFADLLSGLNESTPLVKVAQVRTATDRDRIMAMTPEQRRMRAEWQRRRAAARPAQDTEAFLGMMQAAFAASFGS